MMARTGRDEAKPELRYASAGERAEKRAKEAEQRKAEATARRLATRARNALDRPPRVRPAVPKTGKPAAFYLPDNYDLGTYPEHLRWYAAYFLNLIHWRTVTWRANAAGFVQLLYPYLDRVIPRPFLKAVKERLEADGVVVCDREAVKGRRAYGYRVTEPYLETHRVVCPDEELNRKIRRVSSREERAWLRVHRWRNAKLRLLALDRDRARAILSTRKPRKRARKAPLPVAEYRRRRADYCDMVAHGDHWFVCDDYGRVHTPLTALEGALRCCLSAEGQPLVNVDLVNSQPLFLALLAKQWLTGTDMARSRLRNRECGGSNPYHAVCQSLTHNQHKTTAAVPTRINSVNHTATPCGAMGLGHSGSVSVHADLDECLDVGLRGGFYESMMTADELAQGGKYRDRLKRRFCGVLFGENQGRGR